jgi:hypothetical protein
VNTFEQLIGRQITNILRLDTGDDFPPLSFPLAIFVMLDNNSGLSIGFGFHSETTELNYMTLTDFEDYYGTEYGEVCLNELKNGDPLNKLVGQKIKSLKVGQLQDDKIKGDNFVIKSGQYAGVILVVDNNRMTIYSTKTGGQILFDTEETFPNKKNWVLT